MKVPSGGNFYWNSLSQNDAFTFLFCILFKFEGGFYEDQFLYCISLIQNLVYRI